MSEIVENNPGNYHQANCPCCGGNHNQQPGDMTRRKFVRMTGTSAIGTVALSGLSWSMIRSWQEGEKIFNRRRPLVVKPVLTYEIPQRRSQTSWRNWGGIQTEKEAADEAGRIQEELNSLKSRADFPLSFLPLTSVKTVQDINQVNDLGSADLFLVYPAGGGMNMFDVLNKMGKDIIFFCRQKSGPVYLWYEIISPRYLRQHTDSLKVTGIDEADVVIDSQDELLWRLRALCGLRNTISSKILTIGGAGAWSQPPAISMKHVSERYKLDIHDVSYEELGKLITEAKAEKSVVNNAESKADEYLKDSGVKLETDRKFVENCFILEAILIGLMEKFSCRAVTINNCMGTIMPLAETTACLTLSLLNDAGYLAFCESDFIVIPAGVLMANISGKPSFLNDPTYPHDKIITLAHCTAPRRMDGKTFAPARILTHFESDYGAAPKVEMKIGQEVTNIIADFEFKRYVGLPGRIKDNPFLAICRSQIDVGYECESMKVAEQMQGFHWITTYGNYLREAEYALKKIGINFENLG
ncbi:MAG: sugar isomerase [Bacteroidota bacterium]|nr:sugar isomerase [Bacteroidota bacterium]